MWSKIKKWLCTGDNDALMGLCAVYLACIMAILLCFLLSGCKTIRQATVHTEHDSTVQVRILRDSVLLAERDSVYIFQTPDSIYKEVWRVRYRDRERLRVDTVFMEKIKCDTVIQIIEKPAKINKGGKITALIVAFVVVLVLLAALWFYRRKFKPF